MSALSSGRAPDVCPGSAISARTLKRLFSLCSPEDTATSKELLDAGGSYIDLKYGIDGYNKFLDPDGYPAVTPPWGTLNAINLDTGDYAWKKPFGDIGACR